MSLRVIVHFVLVGYQWAYLHHTYSPFGNVPPHHICNKQSIWPHIFDKIYFLIPFLIDIHHHHSLGHIDSFRQLEASLKSKTLLKTLLKILRQGLTSCYLICNGCICNTGQKPKPSGGISIITSIPLAY